MDENNNLTNMQIHKLIQQQAKIIEQNEAIIQNQEENIKNTDSIKFWTAIIGHYFLIKILIAIVSIMIYGKIILKILSELPKVIPGVL